MEPSLGSLGPFLEKGGKLCSIFSHLPIQVLGLKLVLDGLEDHTELPEDSPLSREAGGSHPPCSPGLVSILLLSLDAISKAQIGTNFPTVVSEA